MVFNRTAKTGNNARLNEHFNYARGQRRRAASGVLYTYGNLSVRLNEILNDSVNKGVIINSK